MAANWPSCASSQPLQQNLWSLTALLAVVQIGAAVRALLGATRHIARILVHPQNADVVYVAALGHAWGPNPERGVYRSTDGGKTWTLVLHRDDHTGAIDLSLDPNNPRPPSNRRITITVLTREAEERLMGKGIPEITSTELLTEKRENPPPSR